MTTQPAEPMISFDQWENIDNWMKEKALDPLRKAVEKKVGGEWGMMDLVTGSLFPGGGVVKLMTGFVKSQVVKFPPFRDREGNSNPVDSGSTLTNLAKRALSGFEGEAKDLVSDIENLWETKYKPTSAAPLRLHEKSEAWMKAGQGVADVPQRAQGVQSIPGWTGGGAEAYGEIVPSQSGAAQKTGQILTDGSTVLGNAAKGLQSLYASFAAQVQHATTLIENYDGKSEDHWQWIYNTAPNARYAVSVLKGTYEHLSDTLPGSSSEWADKIDDASDKVVAEDDLNEYFVDQKWPESKSDRLKDLKPGEGGPDAGGMPGMLGGPGQYPGMGPGGPGSMPYPQPDMSTPDMDGGLPPEATDVKNLDDVEPESARPPGLN